ncbi:Conjugal transfer protein TraG [Gemmata sp. SH-PL17]|uniref:type IV secretory system conjugative DNA transfer family protein n=1 Tax=Gemmata sp. SH-PL17 TaxID=1630693 RepID=UPI00078D0C00|nr:type IV secretory system conjugative DNA transfer family protein [Gemmata sp. SH-PL17]AMV24089.1 Conjugal transfer protein TraG [Gemmata sp. SH-PL17]
MYRLTRLVLVASVLAALYGLMVLAALTAPWSVVLLVVLAGARLARNARRPHLTAHGTARTADLDDVRNAGLLDAKGGLILGRLATTVRPLGPALRALFDRRLAARPACEQFLRVFRRRRNDGELVRLNNAVHSVVFAPTGAGKNVSCIASFLLTCPDTCVVIDFKGENARLTAAHRRRVFGHRTVVLDPFRIVTDQPDALNPLDAIAKQVSDALDDIRAVAEALAVRTGQEKEPHWADSAETWIAAQIACVAHYAPPDDRSLQTVRGLLTDPKKMETAVQLLCASNDEYLARMGHQLTQFKDKELSSVLTTTNRFLRFLDTPAIAASTRASSFDPAELRRGKMTVYLVLPPEHMRACMGLLRLWIGTLMRAVVHGGLQESRKIHFVLDEAASLGHGMNALADAVDKYRGYGIRCQFYYQSMGQLKNCWPEDQGQTLLSNTAQVFFGVNDLPTAEYVSNRLGEATVVVTSGGSSTGRSYSSSSGGSGPGQQTSGSSSGHNDNWSQVGRRLLKPDEVLNLDPRTAITFAPGVPPILTRLLRYYEERGFGRPPGPVRQLLKALNDLCQALLLLLIAAAFALAALDTASGPARSDIGAPAPGPSPTGTGFPAGRDFHTPPSAPKGR